MNQSNLDEEPCSGIQILEALVRLTPLPVPTSFPQLPSFSAFQTWYRRNREKEKRRKHTYYLAHRVSECKKQRARMLALKTEVIRHYSPSGTCQNEGCNFSDIRALTIDHIDGGGNKHRRQLFPNTPRGAGNAIYRWLKNAGYPDGFRVLCMNCQFILSRTKE